MLPTRASARSVLVTALIFASLSASGRAQDSEPSAGAPAAAAPKVRPKPKLKLAVPKTAASPAAHGSAVTHAAWPTGASTVSESYGDWTMTCVRPADKTACVVAQSQGDSKTGRRRFGIELKPPQDGQAQGVVVMPFGLAIEPGITFKLDDQVLGKGAPYSSCTGEGCLVSISFPTLATDAMRNAKVLTVIGRKTSGATGIEAGEPASITVPLVGFSQAFDRAMALSG